MVLLFVITHISFLVSFSMARTYFPAILKAKNLLGYFGIKGEFL
jgi:hypothetical protein